MTPSAEFSFCEAQPSSGKWHIRKLTVNGYLPGGGIDSESLCRRVKRYRGWDVLAPITALHLRDRTCPECRAMYRMEHG